MEMRRLQHISYDRTGEKISIIILVLVMNLTLNAAALNSRQKGHLDSNFALAGDTTENVLQFSVLRCYHHLHGHVSLFIASSLHSPHGFTNLLPCCLSRHLIAL
ncbi:hypothetical protein POM88_041329 [Heracleum sosnowskyi]|uniref:Uncharacterized protein n=1 Tax=Heracleum sosnowskyi TaxID=360622 RepID=A0AAD8HFP6_9APIA|nr:hypothetical protein POM88_041329 [Heracleum sosnowskyi]